MELSQYRCSTRVHLHIVISVYELLAYLVSRLHVFLIMRKQSTFFIFAEKSTQFQRLPLRLQNISIRFLLIDMGHMTMVSANERCIFIHYMWLFWCHRSWCTWEATTVQFMSLRKETSKTQWVKSCDQAAAITWGVIERNVKESVRFSQYM